VYSSTGQGDEVSDEAQALELFTEQIQPVITAPGDLIAQGLMPQIPYEKLSRLPDGFERLGDVAARAMTRRSETTITVRHITTEQGRTWPDHDDPDRPQVVAWRVVLLGAQGHEGGEPDQWIIGMEQVGGAVSALGWTRDRADAAETFARMVATVEEKRRG
jgi:hypothetical protein